MGLVTDVDSVESMLYDLNKDYNNRSIWASRFGMTSHAKQVGQSQIDEAHSSSLMESYNTYLQNKAQVGNMGLIDSLREELSTANYESLSKAYEGQMGEHRGMSAELYEGYLKTQGLIGSELIDLSGAYAKRADSYLEYMKSGNLREVTMDYFRRVGIVDELGEFADDSLIRNKMFATETVYDDEGNVVINKGDMTNEGRMILNMLQNDPSAGEVKDDMILSYDAWIETQSQYADERIDKSVMRQMLGIEGEYGKQYTKGDLLKYDAQYNESVRAGITESLNNVRLDKDAAYTSIINNQTYNIKESDVTKLSEDFNKGIAEIKTQLSTYDISEAEFNEFLKSEGVSTLDEIGQADIKGLKETVISDSQRGWLTALQVTEGVTKGAAIVATGAVAVATGLAISASVAAAASFGLLAPAAVAAWALVTTLGAVAIGATTAALAATTGREEYEKKLKSQASGMTQYAVNLGRHQATIQQKLEKYLAGLSG